MRRGYKLFKF
ncbi:hypothetical protein YPPY92_4631, partial [Yersinia pestis PY-92]